MQGVDQKNQVFGLRPVATTRDCFEREIVAATDQAISGVPGRYAAALFELAAEAKAIDKISDGLSTFQTMLAGSTDLQRLVRSLSLIHI